jgi:hypothetical protein
MVPAPVPVSDMFTYDLKYADGSVEHNAKADWLTFDMRPNLQPEVCATSQV